jgi:hypothetical protein
LLHRSALAAGGGDPLDEVALAEEEDDQHGQGGDDAGGQHDLPLALAKLVEDDLEASGQGEQRVVAQVGGVAAPPCPLGMIRT